VLSDGAGTTTGYRSLLAEIRAEPVTEGASVRVFTVAYGDNARDRTLSTIATHPGARSSPVGRRTSGTSIGVSRRTSEVVNVREIRGYRIEREIGRRRDGQSSTSHDSSIWTVPSHSRSSPGLHAT